MTPAPAWHAERDALIDELRRDGIRDERVLAALAAVPRHEFVPLSERRLAWRNHPLPIGSGQTISQPYVVAFMTEAARLRPGASVLEVGAGSGYQAAVLAEVLGLGPAAPAGAPRGRLATLEIVPELAERARLDLARLGYGAVEVHDADGTGGWPAGAPYEAILVTAAPRTVPPALCDQLAEGGRLLVPVGDDFQQLVVVVRHGSRFEQQALLPVRFVPMTGAAERDASA